MPPLFATCGLFCATGAFVWASTRGAAIANAEIKQSAQILNGFINLPRRLNITNCSFVATFCATQSRAPLVPGSKLRFSHCENHKVTHDRKPEGSGIVSGL